jgi:nucleotide-binding universal stress UspA family protein
MRGAEKMALKDILVQVDDTEQCDQRLTLAFELAATHGAHLSGIAVIEQPALPTWSYADLPPQWFERQLAEAQARIEVVEKDFRKRAQASGVAAEWRCFRGNSGEILCMNARYSDLTILSQPDPATNDAQSSRYAVERVLLESGHGCLIIPYIGAPGAGFANVLVAWNASREATRAVTDAIPILEQADKVTVLAVNPHDGPAGHGDVPGADISLYLARHGVKAEAAQTFAKDVEIGNIILSRAADTGADLIVMGAYGHSRLREMVLGGATRELLDHMTVPVLMAH